MDFIEQVSNQRAIEALRSGVPNRDAVEALGCTQPDIEAAFLRQLNETKEVFAAGKGNHTGLIIAGDFGSGKSHLLEHLTQIALRRNFVCSKIVISKETPMFDPAKMYRAAAGSATVYGKRGNALTEVMTNLAQKINTQEFESFYRWTHEKAGIHMVFGAILNLYRRLSNDPELRNRIIRFLNGDDINHAEIRRLLRICGELSAYRFDRTAAPDFTLQKFKFVSRMITVAGFSGWVLFFDEVELIARYSLLQRAKSYAQIARWTGKIKDSDMPGIASVLAITEDYMHSVIIEKDDLEKAPARLRVSGKIADQQLAAPSERGIKALKTDLMLLKRPDRSTVDETYRKVRDIYTGAYGWEPDRFSEIDRSTSTRMRQLIRGWITEWDLKRLDEKYQPDIETDHLILHYDEDSDLEIASDEGPAETGGAAPGES